MRGRLLQARAHPSHIGACGATAWLRCTKPDAFIGK